MTRIETARGTFIVEPNAPEGYAWDERLAQYPALLNDQPDGWQRKPGHIVFTRGGENESNSSAFIRAKQAELDAIWAAEREKLSQYMWRGVASMNFEPDTRSRWQRAIDRVRWSVRGFFGRFRNAWLCLSNGWEAEDPDARDY